MSQNWNYFIPSFMALVSLGFLVISIPVLGGNYFLYEARKTPDQAKFLANTQRATEIVTNSDLLIREEVFGRSLELFDIYDRLRNSNENSSDASTVELNRAAILQNRLITRLNQAISINPAEYKNFYLAGLLLTNASEFTTNLNFDSSAVEYLRNSIARNPHHPDSYYQLAKIYYRNNQYNAALNTITPAINLRPQNLIYAELYADILNKSGNHQGALNIYNNIKQIKDQNPSNQVINDFYRNQNIESDISEANKKLEEQKNNATPTPTPTPTATPSQSPIPTRRTR